jgi:hypothetical protein
LSDLNYTKGTTKEWDITVTDNGVVQDPATGVLHFKVKESTLDADPVLLDLLSPAGGIVNVDATKARLTLTPANSTTLDPSPDYVTEYAYVVTWTKSGKTFDVQSGKLFVHPDL